jgi:hypothetical protein
MQLMRLQRSNAVERQEPVMRWFSSRTTIIWMAGIKAGADGDRITATTSTTGGGE